MTNLTTKLRLNSTKGNAKNIWLTLVLIFVLMGLNFRTLLIPEWALSLLTICISTFQVISLTAYGYWMARLWGTWSLNVRQNHIFYFALLTLVTIITSDLTRRIVFND